MQPLKHNGKSYSNADAYRTAKATEAQRGRTPAMAQADGAGEAGGEAESHIVHHADGSHTSTHTRKNGEQTGPHDHANLEALKSHLDQFLSEEESEDAGSHESKPENDNWSEGY